VGFGEGLIQFERPHSNRTRLWHRLNAQGICNDMRMRGHYRHRWCSGSEGSWEPWPGQKSGEGGYVVQKFVDCSPDMCRVVRRMGAQLTDRTLAPNTANVGIAKSLQHETGSGRGDMMTWNSSVFIINRDPFRSIRRGRQLFQRKFTRLQGQGGNEGDGAGGPQYG
jgi:hypothetical protein